MQNRYIFLWNKKEVLYLEEIKELFKQYKEIILYLIFGVLTTVVNIVVFELFTNVLNTNYLISNAIAWLISVLFAYITNRIYVFKSKAKEKKAIIKEISSFFGFRLLSGIMDMAFMFIFVSLLHLNESIMKIVVNVIVVILNYIFSKVFIFKKDK